MIIILIVIQANSCKTRYSISNYIDNSNIINIDLEDPQKGNVFIDNIASNIDYIKLETSENCLVGRIKKIIINEKYILLKERDFDRLIIFSQKGKLITIVESKGKGPSEYHRISDCGMDENNNLYIFDDVGQKILIYSINGELINSLPVKFYPQHLFVKNNNEYIFQNVIPTNIYSDGYQLSFMNNIGSITRRMIYNPDKRYNPDYGNRFCNLYQIKDTLCYWESYNDTIYGIDINHNIKARYHLNLGNMRMPLKYYRDDNAFNDYLESYASIHKIMESSSHIFIEGIYNKFRRLILFDKAARSICYLLNGFNNDIDQGLHFWPMGITKNHKLFCYKDIIELKQHFKETNIDISKIKYPDKYNALKEMVEESNIDDNPIIMLVSLK